MEEILIKTTIFLNSQILLFSVSHLLGVFADEYFCYICSFPRIPESFVATVKLNCPTPQPWANYSSHRTSNVSRISDHCLQQCNLPAPPCPSSHLSKERLNVPVSKFIVGWEWGLYRALDEPCKAYHPHTFEVNGRVVRLNVIVL